MEKWLQFVRAHERLISVLVALLLAWLGWRKWVEHRDAADHDLAVVARAKVDADQKSATAAAAQVQQLQQQVNQQAIENQQLRTEVLNAIANRQQQTQQRITTEQTAPLGDVARRWAGIIKAVDGQITPTADGRVVVTDGAVRATTESLENGSAAEANFADLQRLDAGKDQQIQGLNALIASETAAAKAQQVLLADQITACKADVKVAKDEGAKKGRRGFWRGLAIGAGVVAGVAIRFL